VYVRFSLHAAQALLRRNPGGDTRQLTLVSLPLKVVRGNAKPIHNIEFPPVGKTDADVFQNNLFEVMQFMFNHTSLDPDNAEDEAVLAAYKPLGVAPGKDYDPSKVLKIDGKQFRETAEQVQRKLLASISDQQKHNELRPRIF
jgi:hypothetical protein